MKTNRIPLSRRGFLKSTALATSAIAASRWTARSYAQVVGSNSDLRVAVVGVNAMGRSHMQQIRQQRGARLVALCDPDSAVLDSALAAPARGATQPSQTDAPIVRYPDYRKLLENKEIDAVTIATPNHWHALMTIWGVQAGKDVLIEKPTSHNVWEGRQTLLAARKYNRIVQAGTMWRSMPQVYEALEYAKGGKLGKILVSRGFCYKRRASIGKVDGAGTVPATCDYDLWCGPAETHPLHRAKLHYDWHWQWDTGNGDIGNQGAHQLDLARWVINKPTVAPSVISVGGRLGYIDDGETPNTMISLHDYGDVLLTFEVRGLPREAGSGNQMDQYKGVDVGNIVECEGGYVRVSSQACVAMDKDGKEIQRFTGSTVQNRDRSHMGNFLNAVRSRNREMQNGEIEDGTVSSALAHYSNISHQLGQKTDLKTIKQALEKSAVATEMFSRLEQHLTANNIKLDDEKLTLGAKLNIDPKTDRLIGNESGNARLKGKYRAPFVVPETV